jgi:hypothetical protein
LESSASPASLRQVVASLRGSCQSTPNASTRLFVPEARKLDVSWIPGSCQSTPNASARLFVPEARKLDVSCTPLSLDALPSSAVEMGVSGACHELAPGLKERDQPSRIAAVARLELKCAYTGLNGCSSFCDRACGQTTRSGVSNQSTSPTISLKRKLLTSIDRLSFLLPRRWRPPPRLRIRGPLASRKPGNWLAV